MMRRCLGCALPDALRLHMLQGADTEALIATCRLLSSSSSLCLIAVEQRTSKVYNRFLEQARAAFAEVRLCGARSHARIVRALCWHAVIYRWQSDCSQVTNVPYQSQLGCANQIQLIAMSSPVAAQLPSCRNGCRNR